MLTYIKPSIKYSDTKFEELNVSCKDVEMLWVALEISNMRPVVVISIYRPPQGDSKKWNTLVNEAFERANLKDNTEIFLLGDFNIDFNDKQSNKTKDLEFTTRAIGLNQIIKSSTRTSFRNETKTEYLLDLIFTNSDHISEAKVLDYNISDHLAILATRKKRPTHKEKSEFSGRSYKNYNREEFQNNLNATDWAPFYEINEPNARWDFMEKVILTHANTMCLIKNLRVNARREPWITNEAIEAISDKDRLLNKAKCTGKAADWE